MSLDEKIEALKLKHHKLEAALEEEKSRPQPDEVEISIIKKQKLRIKDQLASLSAL
ncbi:MAG: YdcH family protein [Proteobacteria bacterium]|nr:YdcH family protein [Pseudomonadota bacterium]